MSKINKIKGILEKYFNLKIFVCIKDGMVFTIPFTIVGSTFLVLLQLQSLPETLELFFSKIVNYSFNSIGLIACLGIAYSYNKKNRNFLSVITVLLIYLILCTSSINNSEKSISLEWMGSKGIVTAIISATMFSYLFEVANKYGKRWNVFTGLPSNIKMVFESIFPSFICLVTSSMIAVTLEGIMKKSVGELIYSILQIPLQNISDTFFGAIVITAVISLLWFFGIHGNALISGVVTPILLSNSLANQELVDKGLKLSVLNGAHIVTHQFLNQFITLSGSGISLGLIIVMIFFSGMSSNKELGKLALLSSLFNINEPIIFGVPIILNPYLFLPFFIVPIVSTISLYLLIYWNIIPPFNGTILPWVTPPILSGFLLGDYRYALFQLGQIAFAACFYLPFFKNYEKISKNQKEGCE